MGLGVGPCEGQACRVAAAAVNIAEHIELARAATAHIGGEQHSGDAYGSCCRASLTQSGILKPR
jgi:cobalamin synthase